MAVDKEWEEFISKGIKERNNFEKIFDWLFPNEDALDNFALIFKNEEDFNSFLKQNDTDIDEQDEEKIMEVLSNLKNKKNKK